MNNRKKFSVNQRNQRRADRRLLIILQIEVIRLRTLALNEVQTMKALWEKTLEQSRHNDDVIENDLEVLGEHLNKVLDHLGMPELPVFEEPAEWRLQ